METPTAGRDFSSVSPSAMALLLLKGMTNTPFARQAAQLMPDFQAEFDKRDFTYWLRTVHFEMRYQSVDQLMQGLDIRNVLELSSGYSFRGLHTVNEQDVHYIDTDLENVIDTKLKMIATLQDSRLQTKGKLETLPLNALDEQQFKAVVSRFGNGPLLIVNEGLLMYLDTEEKKKLCAIIRNVLQERGGYWITADVYFKIKDLQPAIEKDDALQQFFQAHHIEENKFDDRASAEAFFKKQGFVIDKEAQPDRTQLSSLKYLLESASEEQLAQLGGRSAMQQTWRLRLG